MTPSSYSPKMMPLVKKTLSNMCVDDFISLQSMVNVTSYYGIKTMYYKRAILVSRAERHKNKLKTTLRRCEEYVDSHDLSKTTQQRYKVKMQSLKTRIKHHKKYYPEEYV